MEIIPISTIDIVQSGEKRARACSAINSLVVSSSLYFFFFSNSVLGRDGGHRMPLREHSHCVFTQRSLRAHKWNFHKKRVAPLFEFVAFKIRIWCSGNNPVGFLPALMSFHQMPVIMPFFYCSYLIFGMRSKSKEQQRPTEQHTTVKRITNTQSIWSETTRRSRKMKMEIVERKWQVTGKWWNGNTQAKSQHSKSICKLIIIIIARKWMYISPEIQRLNHY